MASQNAPAHAMRGMQAHADKPAMYMLNQAGFLTVIPDMFDGQPVDASVMETMVVMVSMRLGNSASGQAHTAPQPARLRLQEHCSIIASCLMWH